MKIIQEPLKGLKLIEPKVFGDQRGYFYESYNEKLMHSLGIDDHFVQDNQSFSSAGVLRGLHFQNPPFAQGKLVRVIKGAVLDVALDIRANSPTYGKHFAVELNEENKLMFWVPPGFAHGFLTLKDETIFSYKCTNLYNKESEGSVLWNDPELNIDWGTTDVQLSEKDSIAEPLKKLKSQFTL